MTGIDWSNCPIVERNPNKLGGVPTLRALRISADQIIENWEAGVETIDIAEIFDLDYDDVNALLEYARTAPRLAHTA